MEDELLDPLLDTNINKEYKSINEEINKFKVLYEQVDRDIERKTMTDSQELTDVLNKLQNLKSQMEKILLSIQYINNFTTDQALLNKLKSFTDEMTKKYNYLNTKFEEKLENARRQINAEIEERTNTQKNYAGLKVMQKLDAKTRIDIDRLKERQEEIEKITAVSRQLLKLSQEMKLETVKQGRMVDSIESHLVISNTKTHEANEQLNKRKETQSFNINCYFWICTTLCVLVVLLLVFIYWKYWRVESSPEKIFNN